MSPDLALDYKETERGKKPGTKENEHNTLFEITLYQTIKKLREACNQWLKKANITATLD